MPKKLNADFGKFALVSGTGWVIDVALTVLLVDLGLTAFWGSAAGAAVAVTFVYVVSRLAFFGQRQLGDAKAFGAYIVWQVCAIAAASLLVAALASLLADFLASGGLAVAGLETAAVAAGVAKALVTPLTLIANFLFMRWLTNHGADETLPPEQGT